MREFTAKLRRFRSARDGATAIEYAIIAAGVAAAIARHRHPLGGSVRRCGALSPVFSANGRLSPRPKFPANRVRRRAAAWPNRA